MKKHQSSPKAILTNDQLQYQSAKNQFIILSFMVGMAVFNNTNINAMESMTSLALKNKSNHIVSTTTESALSIALKNKYAPVPSSTILPNQTQSPLSVENNNKISNTSASFDSSSAGITLNSSEELISGNSPLGWYVFENDTWSPAQNRQITKESNVAIHIHGGDGVLSTNIGRYLSGKKIYNKVLGFRYDSTKELDSAGTFFANSLKQLLSDTAYGIRTDIFAYSSGAMATRWALEIEQVGQYKNINRVVLIGNANTGFYFDPSLITQPDSNIAAQLALYIHYNVIDKMVLGHSDLIPNNQLKGGITLQPSDNNTSTFLRTLNETPVSDNIYKNLKYYILTGTNGETFIPFNLIELMTSISNVFQYAENSLQLGIDPAAWRNTYPTLGLLWQKAFVQPNEIALGKRVNFDGFAIETSSANTQIPSVKSLFFKNNSTFALRSVPLNHAQLAGIGLLGNSLPNEVVKVLDEWIK